MNLKSRFFIDRFSSLVKGYEPSEEALNNFSDDTLNYLKGRYYKRLGIYSFLLVLSFLLLFGVTLLNRGSGSSLLTGSSSYVTEESGLSSKLNRLLGEGNWRYGIYHTKMNAYRVYVKQSDGSEAERFYRYSGGELYLVNLEED